MNMTESTMQMAQKVLDYITFNPHAHAQAAWYDVDSESPDPLSEAVISEDKNVCNTTMCIAGTTQFLNGGIEGLRKFDTRNEEALWDAQIEAASLLGLDHYEMHTLFLNFDDEDAVAMLTALANGDEDKFNTLARS